MNATRVEQLINTVNNIVLELTRKMAYTLDKEETQKIKEAREAAEGLLEKLRDLLL